MELNKKVVEKLANLLSLNASDLSASLSTDKDIELPKIYTDKDVETLTANIQKEKYEAGKKAGEEMTLKNLKKSYSEKYKLEVDVKDFNELINFVASKENEILKSQLEEIKSDSNLKADEKVIALQNKIKEFEQEKANLQGQIEMISNTYSEKEKELINRFNSEKANNSILQGFAGLNFAVPQHISALGDEEVSKYLNTQKQNAINIFKGKYEISFDEDGKEQIIDKVTGNAVKDELQNNVNITGLVVPFAKQNYFNIDTSNGAGRQSSNGNSNGNFSNMSKEDFDNYMKEKNIKPNTEDFDVAYSEFRKNNQ